MMQNVLSFLPAEGRPQKGKSKGPKEWVDWRRDASGRKNHILDLCFLPLMNAPSRVRKASGGF
jgi:hypothetical protein